MLVKTMLSVLEIITYSVIYLFLILVFFYDYYERKTGVPTFPTMPWACRKIIEIIKDDATKKEITPYTIIDLGSGSGQLCFRIARTLPKAKVIGIELSYIPWLRSVLRKKLFRVSNLEFKRMDFWEYDLSSADAIVTYLPGKIMDRVGEKLQKELKTNALVIANVFPLGSGWKPFETYVVGFFLKTKIYVYRKGICSYSYNNSSPKFTGL